MSGGYFEALGIAGRLIDDHRTTGAAARFHSFLGNIQYVSNIPYNVVCVCVCVCVTLQTKKDEKEILHRIVKIFVVVEIHSKILSFSFFSSVISYTRFFLTVLHNIGVSRDVIGCSVKNQETKNQKIK